MHTNKYEIKHPLRSFITHQQQQGHRVQQQQATSAAAARGRCLLTQQAVSVCHGLLSDRILRVYDTSLRTSTTRYYCIVDYRMICHDECVSYTGVRCNCCYTAINIYAACTMIWPWPPKSEEMRPISFFFHFGSCTTLGGHFGIIIICWSRYAHTYRPVVAFLVFVCPFLHQVCVVSLLRQLDLLISPIQFKINPQTRRESWLSVLKLILLQSIVICMVSIHNAFRYASIVVQKKVPAMYVPGMYYFV